MAHSDRYAPPRVSYVWRDGCVDLEPDTLCLGRHGSAGLAAVDRSIRFRRRRRLADLDVRLPRYESHGHGRNAPECLLRRDRSLPVRSEPDVHGDFDYRTEPRA